MFITLKEIQKLFPEYPYKIIDQKYPICMDKYRISEKPEDLASPDPHCLYIIADSAQPFHFARPADCSILFLTDDLTHSVSSHDADFHSILKLQTTDLTLVRTRLYDFYDRQYSIGLVAESLLDILFFESGIQAMIDQVYPAFGNPIYVFDNAFNLIASTWDAGNDKEQGKGIIENQGFTEKEFEVLNLSHIHKKILSSSYPIHSKHPVYGYDQLICAIDTHKDMGHIVVNGVNRDLTEMDQQVLYLLKNAIGQQMKKDEFIRNNRGFHYENFLRDLLDKKIAIGKAQAQRMNYVTQSFSGNFYCIVIEAARSSNTLNTMHIRYLFEAAFPDTMTLMYNGGIVILLRLNEQQLLQQKDYDKITELCKEYGMFAGMGNNFHNIFDLAEYYQQGLRAIELGCRDNSPSLYIYRNYYLAHIVNIFAQKESVRTFCHPQLQTLLDYDRKNHANLAYILYMYLVCERNTAVTAQAMYIHRNTLVYRLKKINSLIDFDYDNYQERQHIILSFEFLKNEGRLPPSDNPVQN